MRDSDQETRILETRVHRDISWNRCLAHKQTVYERAHSTAEWICVVGDSDREIRIMNWP
jgi:hypothetical protein